MGHKIHKQKYQSQYSVSSQEILHIVNMELLDPSLRSDYQKNIFLPHGSKNIIQKDDNNYGLEIWNQNFYRHYR